MSSASVGSCDEALVKVEVSTINPTARTATRHRKTLLMAFSNAHIWVSYNFEYYLGQLRLIRRLLQSWVECGNRAIGLIHSLLSSSTYRQAVYEFLPSHSSLDQIHALRINYRHTVVRYELGHRRKIRNDQRSAARRGIECHLPPTGEDFSSVA